MNQNSSQFLPQQAAPQARYIPSYLQNQCQCQLCAYQYDLAQRVPMMLCGSQHTSCLVCVKQIIMRKKQCPFCRMDINLEYVHKNRMLCKILQEVAKRKNIPIKINQNPQKQFIQHRRTLVLNEQHYPPDINISLFLNPQQNVLNDYQALLDAGVVNENQSICSKFCQRIQISDPLYCFAYFLIMVYNLPFFICQLNYSMNYEQYSCLDKDYGVGMSLRTWMKSSSIIGMSMYGLQVLVIFWKLVLPYRKKCPQSFTIINILAFLLKFLGYNILGFVIYSNIDQNGVANCSGSVLAYMETIFIIEIVIVCGLCSFADRRRR